VGGELPRPLCELGVAADQHSAAGRRHDLADVEAQNGDRSDSADLASPQFRPEGLSRVVDGRQPEAICERQNRVEVARVSHQVYCDDGAQASVRGTI